MKQRAVISTSFAFWKEIHLLFMVQRLAGFSGQHRQVRMQVAGNSSRTLTLF